MKFMILIILCFFALGCEPYKAPDPNGPNGSWWVGGLDGGVYIKIEDDADPTNRIYKGSVYFDYDKTLWYKGRFEYSKNTTFNYKNHQLYSGWNGSELFLKDKSFLKAIDPMPAQ